MIDVIHGLDQRSMHTIKFAVLLTRDRSPSSCSTPLPSAAPGSVQWAGVISVMAMEAEALEALLAAAAALAEGIGLAEAASMPPWCAEYGAL